MRLPKLLIFVFAFCFLFFAAGVSAQEEFTINFDTSYSIRFDGAAEVAQHISLKNNLSRIYATSYALVLEGKRPEGVSVVQNGNPLPFELSQEGEQWKVEISFPDPVVGKDATRNFSINYTLNSVAMRNGQVWEVTIPRLASPESINSYRLSVRAPTSFGQTAYVSPQPRSKAVTDGFQFLTFEKDDLTRAGIVAAFGEFQVFSFQLKYHLQNPYSRTGETQIALPPDTAFQRVYYELIEPRPRKIELSPDGNWLATYRLKAGERIDVLARGNAQIFTTPQEHYPLVLPDDPRFLQTTQYWPANDPEIQNIARGLITPRAIYDYVVNTLSYNYDRVREGVERLGGKKALESPEAAICMEFTDLFITLSRARGIPTREINGYAYTENPEVQPLSLVADVLHAWPEYWDKDEGVWRPVDPTWGKTTGGVDFFDKFDLSHIVFAIHSADVNYPPPAGSYKLGPNPEKDVSVSFGQLPEKTTTPLSFSAAVSNLIFPFLSASLNLRVENQGPVAFYDLPLEISGSGVKIEEKPSSINFLPPFSSYETQITFKPPFLPSKNGQQITFSAGTEDFVYNMPTTKILALQVSTIFASLLLFIGLVFVLIQVKVYARVKNVFKKIANKAGSLFL